VDKSPPAQYTSLIFIRIFYIISLSELLLFPHDERKSHDFKLFLDKASYILFLIAYVRSVLQVSTVDESSVTTHH
jgi:hypothetical protein